MGRQGLSDIATWSQQLNCTWDTKYIKATFALRLALRSIIIDPQRRTINFFIMIPNPILFHLQVNIQRQY